jgi:nucleotide-binding universal stress UspA family protein
MIENIQIYLDGGAEDETRIAHAELLMRDRPRHVTGLYVNVLPSFTPLPNEAGASAIIAHVERLREHGAATVARLRPRLDRLASTSDLRKIEGPPRPLSRRMATEARSGDIFIASCPYRGGTGPADDIIEAVLLGAGRSVYLVPQGRRPNNPIGTVLVAWADTREATRAINEAMPLLRLATRTQIIFVKSPKEGGDDAAAAMTDLAANLDRHGAKVEIAVIERGHGSTAEVVLEQGRRVAADLIVAGAYGHSRMREWLVGGVTRELFERSEVPLLVAH